ncbi:MAG: fatty acid desaturase [Gemmatimonas sp.]
MTSPRVQPNDFTHTDEREPHHERTRRILRDHPQVRALIGKNPLTFLLIVAIVAAQVTLAGLLHDAPWWGILLAAYAIGAFADHALFVMVHECAHNLVFRTTRMNVLAAIVANLPQFFPSAVSFRRYHLKHHSFQGVHELDADLPGYWEARLINNYAIGKALWLLFFPVFQITRTARTKEIAIVDGWILLNWAVQITFNVAVWIFLGPKAFLYLLLSFFFSVGLHPLGARWIQEHYLTQGTQETYSYYGRLNLVAMNVGYHNEHHDFPSVPWNRLPELKRQVPEAYDSLHAHYSWTKLLLRFLFDQEISLFSRILRKNRGGVAVTKDA